MPQGTSVEGVITPKTEKVHQLAIDIVRPKSNQPRQHFDEQLLDQLALSIKEQGILQPIVVTEVEHNLYSIIAGERRWRAAQLAGLTNVPAIIKQVDELQHLELSLLENIQRSDLNAIETARTIKRLHDDFQQSYESIAQHLGKAYTTVINAVRLLQLPETIQQAVIKGEITEGHARTLLSLAKYPTAQAVLFKDIITKKLSVRQAETIAAKAKLDALQTISKKAVKESATADVSQQLSKHLGVRVNMSKSKTKGKITLSYNSEKEFNRLVRRLES